MDAILDNGTSSGVSSKFVKQARHIAMSIALAASCSGLEHVQDSQLYATRRDAFGIPCAVLCESIKQQTCAASGTGRKVQDSGLCRG